MKIGIVTQPFTNNYGGIMQNWALQQILIGLGHSPITLYCLPRRISYGRWIHDLVIFSIRKVFHFPKLFNHYREYNHLYYRQDNELSKFVRDFIITTKLRHRYEKIDLKQNRIDAIIVGSDQVWRYRYNRFVWKDMFLFFARKYDCQKIGYAISFGTDNWEFSEKQTEKINAYINQFSAISVREKSGIAICDKYLNRIAIELLDPTLLLNKEHYGLLCEEQDKSNIPYIAAYILDDSKDNDAFISAVSQLKNFPVKHIGYGKGTVSMHHWLSIVREAQYIITDSYHGTVFSIIFHKPFFSIVNKTRGTSRVLSLLEKLELDQRIISDVEGPIIDSDICWDRTEQLLNEWKEKSLGFLTLNLDN